MIERKRIYAVIDSERDYQDLMWGKELSPNGVPDETRPGGYRTLDEFILYIHGYAHELMMLGAKSVDPIEKLNFIRKIAALGVHAMEHHGAPDRVITDAMRMVKS